MTRFPIQSEYMFPVLVTVLISISFLIVNLETRMSHATAMNVTQLTIPTYEITTRGNLFNTQDVTGNGYLDKYPLSDIKNLSITCPNEVAIFVHGWGQDETEAKERFDRVKGI